MLSECWLQLLLLLPLPLLLLLQLVKSQNDRRAAYENAKQLRLMAGLDRLRAAWLPGWQFVCQWAVLEGGVAQTVVVIVVVVVVVICRAILHLSRLLHENYKTTGNRFLRRQPLWHDTQRVRSGEDERVLAHAIGSKIVSPIVDDCGREERREDRARQCQAGMTHVRQRVPSARNS